MAFQQNQDRQHIADRGNLSDPKQSAGFVVDPMLAPTSVSSAAHPILPDPNPIDNPELFDASTRHPNTHYHPEKKLSKKKKAKKLGVGSYHPTNIHAVSHHNVDSFTGHEKDAFERQQRKDEMLAAREQHHHDEDDDEDDEDEEDDDDETHSKGEEGTSATHSTSTSVTDKSIKEQDNANDQNASNKEKEQAGHDGDSNKDAAQPSLLSRATATATGLASTVTSTVMNAPIVSTLMSKVGLGGNKSETDKSDKTDGGDSSKPTTNEEVAEASK